MVLISWGNMNLNTTTHTFTNLLLLLVILPPVMLVQLWQILWICILLLLLPLQLILVVSSNNKNAQFLLLISITHKRMVHSNMQTGNYWILWDWCKWEDLVDHQYVAALTPRDELGVNIVSDRSGQWQRKYSHLAVTKPTVCSQTHNRLGASFAIQIPPHEWGVGWAPNIG